MYHSCLKKKSQCHHSNYSRCFKVSI